jgi:phosphoribosylformylglycinamidine cyclo-ligase
MEIYVPEEIAEGIIALASGLGVEAKIIGRCEPFEGEKVTVSGEGGEHLFTT